MPSAPPFFPSRDPWPDPELVDELSLLETPLLTIPMSLTRTDEPLVCLGLVNGFPCDLIGLPPNIELK